MKFIIITAISILWLGCLVELAVLASAAFRMQNAGSIGAIIMMMGWLGLTGVCGWKFTRAGSCGSPA